MATDWSVSGTAASQLDEGGGALFYFRCISFLIPILRPLHFYQLYTTYPVDVLKCHKSHVVYGY